MGRHYLDSLFSPSSIAVFGASETADSVGGRVFRNLVEGGFSRPIYAVNPKYTTVYEHPCYKSVEAINEHVDLAIVATPAKTVPEIIHTCGAHGVRAAVVISAGFGEGDGQGAVLGKNLLEAARQYGIRLLGPNCLGLVHPSRHMNATFSKNLARPGRLALVSQSGALCTAILDWADAREMGFSAIVSMGDALDIDFGEILDYLAQDPETVSILLYVEGIRNARSFMSGLRIAARMKPVVVVKAGRHREGRRAAVTHTGALVGADDVFDAALQRAGVVRAMTVGQWFSAARILASRYRVNGNRLAIITNGGGLGVMATDRAIDLNVQLTPLTEQTLKLLDSKLPYQWSHGNPIDLLGDAPAQRYEIAVKACLDDPAVDGVLVMLSPQAMTDAEACAEAVIAAAAGRSKPLLTCWMGEHQVAAARDKLDRHQIPHFSTPEASVEAFAYLTNHYRNQQLLMQVPGPLADRSHPDIEGARLIIETALAEKRKVLSLTEAKAVLHAFGIPVTQSIACDSANEALVAAESLGYPVVMKINSPDVTHKSDVGGVLLNIGNAQAVRGSYRELIEAVQKKSNDIRITGVLLETMFSPPHARELLIGVVRDPVFGPAITFGAGGVQAEAMQDRAVTLPPLNSFLAGRLIAQTRAARLLQDFRNMPAVDMDALVQVLRRVSELVCELPAIQEMDINPLIAHAGGVMALDVRIVVERTPLSMDRYGHMAIHPYPGYLTTRFQLADGTNITIRPIRPEDASIEQSFVKLLSPQSKYFRFMQGLNELTQEMLIRFTQLDYHRELALIAVYEYDGGETELGVSRYVVNPDGRTCEFALVVADAWQGRGIGSQLMTELMNAARQRGFEEITGEVLATNANMLELMTNLGFSIRVNTEDPTIREVFKQL